MQQALAQPPTAVVPDFTLMSPRVQTSGMSVLMLACLSHHVGLNEFFFGSISESFNQGLASDESGFSALDKIGDHLIIYDIELPVGNA